MSQVGSVTRLGRAVHAEIVQKTGAVDAGRWVVVVPLKQLVAAKSRLAVGHRTELVLAMAADVVAAATAAAGVAEVAVVSRDPRAGELGVAVLDDPATSLQGALRHALGGLGDRAVAVLPADLPALRPEELGAALALARQQPTAFVADTAGTGTTLLAGAASLLRPEYGAGSRVRHAAVATDLTAALDAPGLRQDVDTVADLVAAVALGVGVRTGAALARSRPA